MIEHKVIPLYFDRDRGHSEDWVNMAKESMQSVIPNFSAQRMVEQYARNAYFRSSATPAADEQPEDVPAAQEASSD